jgi:enoyl-CoA hydratase/carnithine racemase
VTPQSFTTISVEHANHIMTVTLDRPSQRNACDLRMRQELDQLWTMTSSMTDLRCIVLTGAGEGFCSGADVSDLAGERRPYGEGLDDELRKLPGRRLDVPVLVAVNGVCAGGGLHFVADADVVIASTNAWFVDPHVNAGQVSGLEGPSLAARVGIGSLMPLVLCGRAVRWDARRAFELGLVFELVEPDALMTRAHELASAIAAASPAAVRASRSVLREFESSLVGTAMEEGWKAVQRHWTHPDCSEGPQAFLEHRPPKWHAP